MNTEAAGYTDGWTIRRSMPRNSNWKPAGRRKTEHCRLKQNIDYRKAVQP